MNAKQILAGLLAGAVMGLSLTGCGQSDDGAAESQAATATPVEVQTVETGPMAAESRLTGTVQATSTVQVFPLLSGTVTELKVGVGDQVAEGQLLFQVDTATVTSTYTALQQSYAATRTATDQAIATAQIAVQNAQIAVDQATTALENAKAMHEIGAVSDQQVTQAEQGLAQAQAGYAQAQSAVQQAQASQQASLAQIEASMAQIEAQAKLGTVTAPVSGLVTAVNIERGGMAAQSAPSIIIAEGGKTEIAVSVSETVFAGIKVGDTAEVTLPAVSDTPAQAVIRTIAPAADQQTKLYTVTLSVPEGLTPPIGAFADVVLYTDRRDNTVYVPTEAILTDGDSQYVFILKDDGSQPDTPNTSTPADGSQPDGSGTSDTSETFYTASKITVTTGLVGDGATEITEGLSGGETLVVKGQSYLSDGAAARIVSEEAEA